MLSKTVAADTGEVSKKGSELLQKYSKDLESTDYGKAIAIEIESGDYFLGESGIEAVKKAREQYPDRIFFLGRIGRKAYLSFRNRGSRY